MSGDRRDTSLEPSDGSASPSSRPKKDRKGTSPTSSPKGTKAKGMTAKEQREAFTRMARALDADETGEAFERAVSAIAKRRAR